VKGAYFIKKIKIAMSDSEFKNRLEQFRQKRSEQNEKVLDLGHLGIKRFFNMDANTYRDGALDSKTKELLGLVASSVLRCNDCIDYHLEQCAKTGSTKEEIVDALNVALIVGGSIVIPHMRHAVGTLEFLEEEGVFN
jgi:AhpD family alkylhydroperoxidase